MLSKSKVNVGKQGEVLSCSVNSYHLLNTTCVKSHVFSNSNTQMLKYAFSHAFWATHLG